MPTLASPALSVLKGWLGAHGFAANIRYDNIRVFRLLEPRLREIRVAFAGAKDQLLLLPFLHELASRREDQTVAARHLACWRALLPGRFLGWGDAARDLERLKEEVIESCLEPREESVRGEPLCVGFSARFHQWLAALALAPHLKVRLPGVPLVIGGLPDEHTARRLLEIGPDFDGAIWGEGELPFLALCRVLGGETDDYSVVPRLVRRVPGGLAANPDVDGDVAAGDIVAPDFGDLITMSGRGACAFEFPVEASRGCHWNRCRFCSFNHGTRHRQRPVATVLAEIEAMHRGHGITRFRFVDTDLVGADRKRFTALLDGLAALSDRLGVRLDFYGEIIHAGFDRALVERLHRAGFTEIQIGYEALTDRLLGLLGKKVDLADHLLFVKWARHLGLAIVGANVLVGAPGETEADLDESLANLKHLRFVLARRPGGFWHNLRPLRLQHGTPFWHRVPEEERDAWRRNPLADLVPDDLVGDGSQRFLLFDFSRPPAHPAALERLERVNRFFEVAEATYRLEPLDAAWRVVETLGGKKLRETILDDPLDLAILGAVNDRVASRDELLATLSGRFAALDADECGRAILRLAVADIVYANADLSRVVSLVIMPETGGDGTAPGPTTPRRR